MVDRSGDFEAKRLSRASPHEFAHRTGIDPHNLSDQQRFDVARQVVLRDKQMEEQEDIPESPPPEEPERKPEVSKADKELQANVARQAALRQEDKEISARIQQIRRSNDPSDRQERRQLLSRADQIGAELQRLGRDQRDLNRKAKVAKGIPVRSAEERAESTGAPVSTDESRFEKIQEAGERAVLAGQLGVADDRLTSTADINTLRAAVRSKRQQEQLKQQREFEQQLAEQQAPREQITREQISEESARLARERGGKVLRGEEVRAGDIIPRGASLNVTESEAFIREVERINRTRGAPLRPSERLRRAQGVGGEGLAAQGQVLNILASNIKARQNGRIDARDKSPQTDANNLSRLSSGEISAKEVFTFSNIEKAAFEINPILRGVSFVGGKVETFFEEREQARREKTQDIRTIPLGINPTAQVDVAPDKFDVGLTGIKTGRIAGSFAREAAERPLITAGVVGTFAFGGAILSKAPALVRVGATLGAQTAIVGGTATLEAISAPPGERAEAAVAGGIVGGTIAFGPELLGGAGRAARGIRGRARLRQFERQTQRERIVTAEEYANILSSKGELQFNKNVPNFGADEVPGGIVLGLFTPKRTVVRLQSRTGRFKTQEAEFFSRKRAEKVAAQVRKGQRDDPDTLVTITEQKPQIDIATDSSFRRAAVKEKTTVDELRERTIAHELLHFRASNRFGDTRENTLIGRLRDPIEEALVTAFESKVKFKIKEPQPLLVTSDVGKQLAKINKDLAIDVRGQPIELVRGTSATRTSRRATTRESELRIQLGELETINLKDIPDVVQVTGVQKTRGVIGERGRIVTKQDRALLDPRKGELTDVTAARINTRRDIDFLIDQKVFTEQISTARIGVDTAARTRQSVKVRRTTTELVLEESFIGPGDVLPLRAQSRVTANLQGFRPQGGSFAAEETATTFPQLTFNPQRPFAAGRPAQSREVFDPRDIARALTRRETEIVGNKIVERVFLFGQAEPIIITRPFMEQGFIPGFGAITATFTGKKKKATKRTRSDEDIVRSTTLDSFVEVQSGRQKILFKTKLEQKKERQKAKTKQKSKQKQRTQQVYKLEELKTKTDLDRAFAQMRQQTAQQQKQRRKSKTKQRQKTKKQQRSVFAVSEKVAVSALGKTQAAQAFATDQKAGLAFDDLFKALSASAFASKTAQLGAFSFGEQFPQEFKFGRTDDPFTPFRPPGRRPKRGRLGDIDLDLLPRERKGKKGKRVTFGGRNTPTLTAAFGGVRGSEIITPGTKVFGVRPLGNPLAKPKRKKSKKRKSRRRKR